MYCDSSDTPAYGKFPAGSNIGEVCPFGMGKVQSPSMSCHWEADLVPGAPVQPFIPVPAAPLAAPSCESLAAGMWVNLLDRLTRAAA